MKRITLFLRALAVSLAVSGFCYADSFSEPSTIFYGRVLAAGSGLPVSLYEGTITWVVQTSAGDEINLEAELTSLKDGEYSYRISVPHSVLALGLAPVTNSVPLGTNEEMASFPRIEIDGLEARIVGSFANAFFSAQDLRTATHRLDLEIPIPGIDTDNDGIPDWWEDRYGLDKQDGSDAAGDLDLDGLSNLDEYNQGYDPTQDSRQPVLTTSELSVYADSKNALLLTSLDSDSSADELTYTLLSAPVEGRLLRMPGASPLNSGASFTQTECSEGKIVYIQDGASLYPESIELAVEDGDTNHVPNIGTVWLYPFRPSESALNSGSVLNGDVPRAIELYLLSSESDAIVLDANDAKGALALGDSGHTDALLFISNESGNHFTGGSGNDIVIPGSGNDQFTLGDGSDVIRVGSTASGSDAVSDFFPGSGDQLDLTHLLSGNSEWLADYVEVVDHAQGTLLNIRADGEPSTTPYALLLAGIDANTVDLATWVQQGVLRIGELRVLPRIYVDSAPAPASENGPTASSFVVRRTGNATDAITVGIQLTGVAVNGTDYSFVASDLLFPAGQSAVEVEILPFTDAITEADEIVQLTVLAGDGYKLGSPAQAELTIEDLKVELSIETLVSHANLDTSESGLLLINRTAVLDQSVLVRLQVSGTASAGSDYSPISPFVNMLPGQTTAMIPVTLLPGATLNGGAETVHVRIQGHADYRLGNPEEARVTLVEQLDSFDDWKDRSYPDASGTAAELAQQDLGGNGQSALVEYAVPQGAPSPRLVWRNGDWAYDAWLRPDVQDVAYVIEFSDELSGWTERDYQLQRDFPDGISSDAGFMSFRLPGTRDLPKQYIRLRLEYRP